MKKNFTSMTLRNNIYAIFLTLRTLAFPDNLVWEIFVKAENRHGAEHAIR